MTEPLPYWRDTSTDARRTATVEETRRDAETYLEGRRRKRMRRYSLNRQQVEQLEATAQCSLCGCDAMETRCLHIDHDHDTGWVRGMLCGACNVGIGHIERFRRLGLESAAVAWIERFAE